MTSPVGTGPRTSVRRPQITRSSQSEIREKLRIVQ